MPTDLSNKETPPHKQNIYQNQSKQTKNGEAHGDVRQDKSGFASGRTVSVSDHGVNSLKINRLIS
jgi:hypothetical protein